MTENGGGGAESEGDAVAQLYALTNAYCEASLGCCSSAAEPFSSVANCVDAVVQRMPLASILSGAVVVDLRKVETCRATLARATDCSAAPPHVCSEFYVPVRRPGEPCRSHRECIQSGNGVDCVLDPSRSSPAGVCTALTVGTTGDPCLSTCVADGACVDTITLAGDATAVCRFSDGLYCDRSAETPTCNPTLPEGDECVDFYACGSDAQCYYDFTQPGNPTICMGWDGWTSCDEVGCDGDLACIDHTCQSPTTFAEVPGCGSALLSL